MPEAFIVDTVRTPRARRKGKFAGIHAVDLPTYPLNAIVKRNKLAPETIQDVIMGCVTQTGEQGWCAARSSVLAAGWPHTVPATTINRLCGSGQQAVNFAAQSVQARHNDLVIAGGMEHMTRVPMFSDCGGEESPFLKKHHPDLVQQGFAAEILAKEYKISRDAADAFAFKSQQKASRAIKEGKFKKSIIPVPYKDAEGNDHILAEDDNPRPETTIQTLGGLKKAFQEDGILTAGNSSAIVDGAAAILIASDKKCKESMLRPRARIVATSAIGSPPRIMLTGPMEASRLVLQKADLRIHEIDIWEINEAFAPVPLMMIQQMGLEPDKINVNGGAIALGHPLGATGAMLIGMALDELEHTRKKYALITMCIGLGMGIATIIERL